MSRAEIRQAALYGLAVAAAVFFIGLTTGMGGPVLTNFGFSLLMGVFGGALFIGAKRLAGRRE